MIELYKFISEEELLEIREKKFREFSSNFPLRFYLDKSFDQNIDEKLIFLVKCEISAEDLLTLKMETNNEIVISSEKLETFNLINYRIKIIDTSLEDLHHLDKMIKDIIINEMYLAETRLKIFLETNSREIITDDYFYGEDDFTSDYNTELTEEMMEKIKNEIRESAKILDKKKEKTININTVEEAVDFLINGDLKQDDINVIKNQSINMKMDSFRNHFGLGTYIRNLFFHGNTNQKFLDDIKEYKKYFNGIEHGEFGEGIIEDCLWRKLNNCETTTENHRKIIEIEQKVKSVRDEIYRNKEVDNLSDEEKRDLWDQFYKELKEGSLRYSSKKVKLLSYNFKEEEIEKYLDLDVKSENDKDNFHEYYYQQKALLVRLNEEEKETFEDLKQDYINVLNIIDILEHKP
jgi:hypothetical protein